MNLPKKSILTFLPLLIVISLDQATKSWAKTLTAEVPFSGLKFNLVFNSGFMMGQLAELPLIAKEVTLTTIAAFIVTLYLFAIFLIPIKSRALYLGLSLLVGGIVGNVIDRLNGLAVVDFISLNLVDKQLPYFNLADLFQWLGYGLIFFGLYRDAKFFWPKVDLREKYLLNPRFQLRTSLLMSSFAFVASSLVLIFSYSFLKTYQSPATLKYFLILGFSLCFLLSALSFMISLLLTHRVAGPLYAIQRHIQKSLAGEEALFKLRDRDEFKEIEKDLNFLNQELTKKKD